VAEQSDAVVHTCLVLRGNRGKMKSGDDQNGEKKTHVQPSLKLVCDLGYGASFF
jgi:hypothetical protein